MAFLLALCCVIGAGARPTEEERVKLWKEKNTWPPNWQYESPEKKALLKDREGTDAYYFYTFKYCVNFISKRR